MIENGKNWEKNWIDRQSDPIMIGFIIIIIIQRIAIRIILFPAHLSKCLQNIWKSLFCNSISEHFLFLCILRILKNFSKKILFLHTSSFLSFVAVKYNLKPIRYWLIEG